MINKRYIQIKEDKSSQDLEETREYIERLKNNLIRKILIQQQTLKEKKKFDVLNTSNAVIPV